MFFILRFNGTIIEEEYYKIYSVKIRTQHLLYTKKGMVKIGIRRDLNPCDYFFNLNGLHKNIFLNQVSYSDVSEG